MLSIDGILLFKMFILGSLYELYAQKHLSLQIQSASIDSCYQQQWIHVCTSIVNNANAALNLYDFCVILFDCFTKCRKSVYKNRDLTTTINYSLNRDKNNSFSIKRFISFLKNYPTHIYESAHIQTLRQELLDLLHHIEITKQNLCDKDVIIKFPDDRNFRNIREYLTVQYEFIDNRDGQRKTTIFVAGCSALTYEVR